MHQGGPTPEKAEIIEEAIRLGLTWELAAQAAGIDQSTLWRWRQRGKVETEGPYFDLVQRLQRAEAVGAQTAMQVIEQAALGGDWKAAAWMLERRHGYTSNGRLHVVQERRAEPVSDEDVLAELDDLMADNREPV